MKIAILSKSKKLYSTQSLFEAAKKRGHGLLEVLAEGFRSFEFTDGDTLTSK